MQLLDRIRLRGTHGIVLKAPDVAEVAAAVARADAAGIPVVTLVTDLPNSARIAYLKRRQPGGRRDGRLSDR